MKSTNVLKTLLQKTGTTQIQLKDMMGLKSQSSVTNYLRSDLRIGTLTKLADALGYEVVIRSKDGTDEMVIDEFD